MKFKSVLLALLLLPAISFAQDVNLGVAALEQSDDIDSASAKTLGMRLKKILSQNGITEDGSDFVVVPKVIITDEALIEGGMKNIYKIQADLMLEIVQMSTGKSFGSTSVEMKGSGMRNKSAALKNAFGTIKYNDVAISRFLDDTKKTIIKYYTDNKEAIFAKAQQAAAQNDYEQAIAILGCIPENMIYADEVNKQIQNYFDQWHTHDCESVILQAKGAVATKQYDQALALLGEIDPNSSCASAASQLLASINSEVRKAEAQERADAQRREDREYELAKAQIDASRPRTIINNIQTDNADNGQQPQVKAESDNSILDSAGDMVKSNFKAAREVAKKYFNAASSAFKLL